MRRGVSTAKIFKLSIEFKSGRVQMEKNLPWGRYGFLLEQHSRLIGALFLRLNSAITGRCAVPDVACYRLSVIGKWGWSKKWVRDEQGLVISLSTRPHFLLINWQLFSIISAGQELGAGYPWWLLEIVLIIKLQGLYRKAFKCSMNIFVCMQAWESKIHKKNW